MYRLPEYGHNVATWAASATLLCLKGLKSSLIFTSGLFLIERVPKNGLGVVGAESDLLALGDDVDAGVGAFILGEGDTLGLGLNDEALTFNRLATVFGEAGTMAGLAEFLAALLLVVFWFVLAEAPFAVAGVLAVVVMALAFCLPLLSFPLNGGIVWMTMLIFLEVVLSAGLAAAEVAAADAAADAAATLAIFCALAAVIDAWALLEAFLDPSACAIGLRVGSEFLAPATTKPREAVVGFEAPMARA